MIYIVVTIMGMLLELCFVAALVICANSAPHCKFFDDPKNGYVTCDSLFHLFCSPECHPGYRFATKPAVVYMCGPVTGEWFTYPAGHMLPWPDCVPDDRNTRDNIRQELAQTREAITKHIVDNQQGIPTGPYATTTADPEDRFHHLYDYIEKAQKAYQTRHAIEQETQALKNENHGNTQLRTTATLAQANHQNVVPTAIQSQSTLNQVQAQTSPAEVRSQISHNYLGPAEMQAQTTRAGTLARATQSYFTTAGVQAQKYPAPTAQAQATLSTIQSNVAQLNTSPIPTTLKTWIPNQTTGSQYKTFAPTPYTQTQTTPSYPQPLTTNAWKQGNNGNTQGRSNAPIAGSFQSTSKPLDMAGQAWNRATANSQYPPSFINSNNQTTTPGTIPGKPFIPVVDRPVSGQQISNPTMATLKPPTTQNRPLLNPITATSKPSTTQTRPLFERTFLTATATPFNGNSHIKHEVPTSNAKKIPLYDRTFLPVRPRVFPGKTNVQEGADTNQHTATNNNFVTQQQYATQSPVIQNHSEFTGNRVTQQHFTMNQSVTQQQSASVGPVTQQHFTMNQPVTQQQQTASAVPVTQQHFTMNQPVTHQQTVPAASVTQQHFSINRPVTSQQISGSSVMQQHLPSKPVTQMPSPQQPIQQESKNILQLLSKGLDKDLKNLDATAHLRPYRDARYARRNITKSNMTSIVKTELQPNYKSPENATRNTGISDRFFNMVETSGNKIKNSDDDYSDHIQPIVISSTSVLDSIASLFAKKKHPQNDKTSGSAPVGPEDSLRKETYNRNQENSLPGNNVTNTSYKTLDRFQSWLKEKAKTSDSNNSINKELENTYTSSFQRNDFSTNSTEANPNFKNIQDSIKINPNSEPRNADKNKLNSLELTHSAPGEPLGASPLTTSSGASRVSANITTNSEESKNTYSTQTTQNAPRESLGASPLTTSSGQSQVSPNIASNSENTKITYGSQNTQNTPRESLGTSPLTTSSGSANQLPENIAPNSEKAKITSKRLVKEHLFYFPVKKNTLVDLFREKQERGR